MVYHYLFNETKRNKFYIIVHDIDKLGILLPLTFAYIGDNKWRVE